MTAAMKTTMIGLHNFASPFQKNALLVPPPTPHLHIHATYQK